MKTPIKNFDPYRPPSPLHSPGSLRNLARRIKTRASNAGGRVARFIVAAVVFWPLWLAIDCVILAGAGAGEGDCDQR